MIDRYPIIKGNCNKCGKCIEVCPVDNMALISNQLVIIDGMKCPENCNICSESCPQDAISYYDGTEESILTAFSGSCHCH